MQMSNNKLVIYPSLIALDRDLAMHDLETIPMRVSGGWVMWPVEKIRAGIMPQDDGFAEMHLISAYHKQLLDGDNVGYMYWKLEGSLHEIKKLIFEKNEQSPTKGTYSIHLQEKDEAIIVDDPLALVYVCDYWEPIGENDV